MGFRPGSTLCMDAHAAGDRPRRIPTRSEERTMYEFPWQTSAATGEWPWQGGSIVGGTDASPGEFPWQLSNIVGGSEIPPHQFPYQVG
jgi:hypothetical protein